VEQTQFRIDFGYNLPRPGENPQLNCLMLGSCVLEFTPRHVIITGRRFRNAVCERRIRHGYALGDWLAGSCAGMLLLPLVVFYCWIFELFLTAPGRLVYDLAQVGDIGGDRDVVGFSILGADRRAVATFCGNTSLDETGRINALLASAGHRVSRLPLP
jgi:hypothetical protein